MARNGINREEMSDFDIKTIGVTITPSQQDIIDSDEWFKGYAKDFLEVFKKGLKEATGEEKVLTMSILKAPENKSKMKIIGLHFGLINPDAKDGDIITKETSPQKIGLLTQKSLAEEYSRYKATNSLAQFNAECFMTTGSFKEIPTLLIIKKNILRWWNKLAAKEDASLCVASLKKIQLMMREGENE